MIESVGYADNGNVWLKIKTEYSGEPMNVQSGQPLAIIEEMTPEHATWLLEKLGESLAIASKGINNDGHGTDKNGDRGPGGARPG